MLKFTIGSDVDSTVIAMSYIEILLDLESGVAYIEAVHCFCENMNANAYFYFCEKYPALYANM